MVCFSHVIQFKNSKALQLLKNLKALRRIMLGVFGWGQNRTRGFRSFLFFQVLMRTRFTSLRGTVFAQVGLHSQNKHHLQQLIDSNYLKEIQREALCRHDISNIVGFIQLLKRWQQLHSDMKGHLQKETACLLDMWHLVHQREQGRERRNYLKRLWQQRRLLFLFSQAASLMDFKLILPLKP